MPWLINATQLDKFKKTQKNVVIVDASWHLPTENRNARDEYLQHHIPGAKFLDLEQFHDQAHPVPNTLIRDQKVIAEKIAALGIGNEHKIIFYDNSKQHTSCRALWMFKYFGHNPFQLYILDTDFAIWEREGGKVEMGESRSAPAKNYTVTIQHDILRTLEQMKENVRHPKEQVVDLRHPVRYAGGQDPRIGVRAGHMPGSFCFPYFTMFDSNGQWKPIDKIRKQLTGLGVELRYPIVTTCGSGMTAAILNFALDLMDQSKHALYDGSWSEWGADTLYPGETSLNDRPVVTSLEK